MLLYIVGLSYIARKESATGPGNTATVRWWALAPLVAPVAIAIARNHASALEPVLLVSAVVALWIGKCVRYTLSVPERSIGRAVSGLLAGIALVDWLAVADAPKTFAVVFIGLFVLALGFQRWVPAT